MATFYNKSWEDTVKFFQFANWVRACDNNKEARCHFSRKQHCLSNMGHRALVSHLNSKKQAAKVTSNISQLQSKQNQLRENTISIEHSQETASTQSTEKFVLQNEVTEAELRWIHKLVLGHLSFNSCAQLPLLFKIMFKDSDGE